MRLGQDPNFFSDFVENCFIIRILKDLVDEFRDFFEIRLVESPGCHRRCAQSDAAGDEWFLGVIGNRVLVAGYVDGIEQIFGFLAGQIRFDKTSSNSR